MLETIYRSSHIFHIYDTRTEPCDIVFQSYEKAPRCPTRLDEACFVHWGSIAGQAALAGPQRWLRASARQIVNNCSLTEIEYPSIP